MLDPRVLVAIGVVILCLTMARFVLIRRKAARKDSPAPTPDRPEPHVADGGVHHDLDRLLIQIQEISRENIARLDTKMRMLNQLLDQADRRIAELRRLAGASDPPPAPSAPRGVSPLHEEVYRLADQGRDVQEISRQVGRPDGEIELILSARKLQPPAK